MEMTKVTKKELVKEVAKAVNVTQKDAGAIIDAFTAAIVDKLVAGNEVKLPGFATFIPQDVPARTARNPRTGESVQVAPHKRLKVKVSKTLKDKVY